MRSLGSIELSYKKVEWCTMMRHNGGHRIPQNHISLSSARGDCAPSSYYLYLLLVLTFSSEGDRRHSLVLFLVD
jgi:uncharacterized protein (DUF169 family)